MTRLFPQDFSGTRSERPAVLPTTTMTRKILSKVSPVVVLLGVLFGVDVTLAIAACQQVWPYPVYPVYKQTNVSLTPTFRWKYFEPDKPWLQQETGKTGYYANVYIYTCSPLGQDPPLWDGDPNSYPVPKGCQTIGVCFSGMRDLVPWTELPYSACWKWDAVNNHVVYDPLPPLQPNHEYWWYVTTACEQVVQFYEGEAWRFNTGTASTVSPK